MAQQSLPVVNVLYQVLKIKEGQECYNINSNSNLEASKIIKKITTIVNTYQVLTTCMACSKYF